MRQTTNLCFVVSLFDSIHIHIFFYYVGIQTRLFLRQKWSCTSYPLRVILLICIHRNLKKGTFVYVPPAKIPIKCAVWSDSSLVALRIAKDTFLLADNWDSDQTARKRVRRYVLSRCGWFCIQGYMCMLTGKNRPASAFMKSDQGFYSRKKKFSSVSEKRMPSSRKHAYKILTPFNPTFI